MTVPSSITELNSKQSDFTIVFSIRAYQTSKAFDEAKVVHVGQGHTK